MTPPSELHIGTGELHQPAEWHGDPMAALGQAFHALSSVSTVIEIPRPTRAALRELLNLYIENRSYENCSDDALVLKMRELNGNESKSCMMQNTEIRNSCESAVETICRSLKRLRTEE